MNAICQKCQHDAHGSDPCNACRLLDEACELYEPATATDPAPRSTAALTRFNAFQQRVRARLDSGRRVYGDSSFADRELIGLVEEIRQEALDVAGWAFILFDRLDELEQKLQAAKSPDVEKAVLRR